MKKTVYTKAGQVGLVEVEHPQIIGSVTPVALAMMGLVTAILAPTGQVVSRLSISVSTMPTGHWLKSLDNLLTIQKAC